MLRLLLILGYIALTVYAIADVAQHAQSKPFGLPKWLWIAAIVVLPFAGATAWIVVKYIGKDGGGNAARPPRAPDDDPEYLAWLEQQRRRRERDKEAD
jgi:uncharacterized membrane protein YhdT